MKNLEQIKRLRKNSDGIKRLFEKKIPAWESDKRTYDKIGWGFNTDSRFKACKGIEVSFDSHMGTYGDSGCSSQLDLDSDIFNSHFLKYLNAHKKEIMLAVASSIDKEAATMVSDAEKELKEQSEYLRRLLTETSNH